MNVPPEVIDVVRRWVQKAEHDLVAATRILELEEGCPYDTACFHLQQVAEKYLKALLTVCGVQAPRTHDLGIVYGLVPVQSRPAISLSDLSALNPHAVDVRYADHCHEPTREEAMHAFSTAQTVREQVRALLPQEATT